MDDVYPNEMNEPHDLDPAAIEALVAGGGRDTHPLLGGVLDDMRVAYASILPPAGPELSALIGAAQPVPARSFVSQRFEQMRSSMLAKIGAATAAVVAATGGLAVANALPAPVQDAVSHFGVGAPSHHSSDAPSPMPTTTTTTTVDPTTTTPTQTTPTTAGSTENHGDAVSAVAHDHSLVGCAHGAAVSNVASDGRSHNDAHDGSCDTTTTIAGSTTTTMDPNRGDNKHGGTTPTGGTENGGGGHGSSHSGDASHGHGGL